MPPAGLLALDVRRLVTALGRVEAYPHPADDLLIVQTHISVVALAGPYAYKVRKPVDLGFLDFSTREKRHHDCLEEVRLNRRLAPDVYLGVVPVTEHRGALFVDGSGPTVEHAVKMRRLPADATLLAHLKRGDLSTSTMRELGRRIATFHEQAASGPEVSRFGKYEVVAENARDNLRQAHADEGRFVSPDVVARLEELLERRLAEHRSLIERRVEQHQPCDTHGDLHLDHVYLFPERDPPRDLIAIDCIEFNERFRYADPVSDVAFLVMDLRVHGRHDLAEALADAYFGAAGDQPGRALLDFYVSYRAAVRGKVEGLMAGEGEVTDEDRGAAAGRARAHWLLALSELEDPAERPCLVLLGGLPGTGKTTLSESLARVCGFEIISSDRTRKRLAGLEPDERAGAGYGEGIYTAAWTERTYEACRQAVTDMLFDGGRVLVDASFGRDEHREAFLTQARSLGVRALFFELKSDPDVTRRRIEARSGGASDADWGIHLRAAAEWEEPASPLSRRLHRIVRADGPGNEALVASRTHLRDAGLL